MKSNTACPPTEELRQLLGSIAFRPSSKQDCTEHLDHCACCQAKLEEMATGGTNLSQRRRAAGRIRAAWRHRPTGRRSARLGRAPRR